MFIAKISIIGKFWYIEYDIDTIDVILMICFPIWYHFIFVSTRMLQTTTEQKKIFYSYHIVHAPGIMYSLTLLEM